MTVLYSYPGLLPRISLSFATIVFGVLAACRDSTGPSGPTLLQTDQLTFDLIREGDLFTATIPYKFTNETGGTVYLSNCNGWFALHLERKDGADWISAWFPGLSACLSPPIIIQEGTTWFDTVHVVAGLPDGNNSPKFDTANPAGTHRIVWDAAYSSYNPDGPARGQQLALSMRVSNSFQLSTN